VQAVIKVESLSWQYRLGSLSHNIKRWPYNLIDIDQPYLKNVAITMAPFNAF